MILTKVLHTATRAFEGSAASARATLQFSGTEFFFKGHFPGDPIVPAVVQIDIALHLASRALGRALLLREVTRAIFKHPVGPGQELDFEISWAPAEERLTRLKCDVHSRDQAIAEFALRVE
jgi:3-hydroxymyristoyl/3-hydroxydecanoyl-(acyl carrier protein) dehydratase